MGFLDEEDIVIHSMNDQEVIRWFLPYPPKKHFPLTSPHLFKKEDLADLFTAAELLTLCLLYFHLPLRTPILWQRVTIGKNSLRKSLAYPWRICME